MNGFLKNTAFVLVLLTVMAVSITKITPWTTDVETHAHTISQIDKEIESALKLTAGATAASAGISLLPDDQCTPIAEEFAELGKYFLIVLSALYLEKYLVTLLGYVSFSFLIPLALLLLGWGVLRKREKVRVLSLKLAVCALAIYFVIPIGVKTSEAVYSNYEAQIDETLNTADQISIANEDEGAINKFVTWIENAAGTIVDYVTNLLSKFIEAVAVMLVTSCVIPILVLLFFAWLIKVLFSVDISLTDAERIFRGKKKKDKAAEEQ